MKTMTLTLLTALTLAGSVQAALPPLYQSSAEINAIMIDDQLGRKLQSGELITDIHKNEQGYLITTNHNRLQVNVEYMPSRPGPVKFNLHFEDPIPLKVAKE